MMAKVYLGDYDENGNPLGYVETNNDPKTIAAFKKVGFVEISADELKRIKRHLKKLEERLE